MAEDFGILHMTGAVWVGKHPEAVCKEQPFAIQPSAGFVLQS